jgi:hypothetical protein
MSRKRQESASGCAPLLILGIPILLVNWIASAANIPAPVIWTIVAALIVWAIWARFSVEHKKIRALQIANIDSMTGTEFELYLEKVLQNRGYHVSITGASGDLGVDLIASKGQDRIAIQVKRHSGTVSRRAISDAVAGMQHYRCNQAMVITNSRFTPGAITLARSTQCSLIDRNELVNWIVQFQTPSTYLHPAGRIGRQLTALNSLSKHHLGVRLSWPIIVVATGLLFALVYSYQNRPDTRSYLPQESKTESIKDTKEVSQPTTLPDSTPALQSAPTPLNPVTPSIVRSQEAASTPSTVQSPLTHSTDTNWPDGKSLAHPERFIKTHIINLGKNSTLKLRGGPGITYKVLAQIPSDATQVFAFDQDQVWDGNSWWCPIEWKGIRGYISRTYLPQ